ncbi:MAG: hypothetical protein V7L26_05120 [Nostoc sp.]|uniref:hypothetical protein n=1 Tax=Nostoc sp. TaxID=1180 RepID=UPI002FEEFF74
MQVEQEIRNAIGLVSPQIEIEPSAQSSSSNSTVTIHDFGRLLAENEPPRKTKSKD